MNAGGRGGKRSENSSREKTKNNCISEWISPVKIEGARGRVLR